VFGPYQSVPEKQSDLRFSTSSLAAWHTAAHKTGPQPTDALRVAFLSLVEAAEKGIVYAERPHLI